MTAKPSVSELREIAQWLKEQAGGLNGHLKRCACVVQSAADWIEGATDETAAPRDVPNEGLTPQQIARGERSGVLRDAVKTEARPMYQLDESDGDNDPPPKAKAIAESRLEFSVHVTCTACGGSGFIGSRELCIDEGCPHHGMPHVCVSPSENEELTHD